ncbi:hypothetical protein ACIBPB_12000 [Micromonospora sp. NPDC049836]|uniref:hypothetical protein n=1 Tax=Micromonospora sp. NPDC049836 TaxID=3364274 RepID=UPI003796ECB2
MGADRAAPVSTGGYDAVVVGAGHNGLVAANLSGGVHGGPGANAARAALLHAGGGRLRAAAVRAAVRRISSAPDRGLLPPPVADLPDANRRAGAVCAPGATGQL